MNAVSKFGKIFAKGFRLKCNYTLLNTQRDRPTDYDVEQDRISPLFDD